MKEETEIDGRVERGDRTAEAILKAATTAFAKAGFDGASVRDIAKRANANPALLRYHFGSKADLYERVVKDAINRLRDRLQAAVAEGGAVPLHQRLLDAYLRFLDEDADFQRLVLRAIIDGDTRLVRASLKQLEPLFESAQPTLNALGKTRQTALLDAIVSVLGAATLPHVYAPLLDSLTSGDWRGNEVRERRLAHLTRLTELMLERMGPTK